MERLEPFSVAFTLAALLLAWMVGAWIHRRLRSVRAQWVTRRALRAERHAEALLRAHGYRVVGRQVAGNLTFYIDGKPARTQVRADLLVRKGTRHLVAEVKTGKHAPHLTTAATRRQLLEYACAFGSEELLLVDMDRREVSSVRVPAFPSRRLGWRPALALVVGAWLTGWLAATAFPLPELFQTDRHTAADHHGHGAGPN